MPEIIDLAAQYIHNIGADAILACGHSGLVGAGALGYITKTPVFAVRKQGEPTVAGHGGMVSAIAPNGKAKRWVWFDDFLGSGGTMRRSVGYAWRDDLLDTPCPAALLLYRVHTDSDETYYAHGAHGGWNKYDIHLDDEITFNWRSVPEQVPCFGLRP